VKSGARILGIAASDTDQRSVIAGAVVRVDREFDGDARAWRLETYQRQPARGQIDVNDERLFVRSADISTDRAGEVVRTATPEGGRPEPLRVARLVARAVADRRRSEDS